jgi:outer membrane protein OmpA-like peptidoglycan-associated protein
VTALAATAVVVLALAAGCARPAPEAQPAAGPTPPRADLYVLLPDTDPTTGGLTVSAAGQEYVLTRPYSAARITEWGRVETGRTTPEEVQQIFGAALAAQPPRPASFMLYFVEGRDEFTPESLPVLQSILGEIARRPAPEIVVIGHTDRVGTVASNDALSLRRAERVRAELVKLGLAEDRIRVAGRGEREPLIPTADEVPEPRNRRVEISVR